MGVLEMLITVSVQKRTEFDHKKCTSSVIHTDHFRLFFPRLELGIQYVYTSINLNQCAAHPSSGIFLLGIT